MQERDELQQQLKASLAKEEKEKAKAKV